ncbi:MmpS family transport accessory protein [Mycobacterium sp. SMC-4]|uniref:MmpS family transport accessory protein n=1 Tax=Mycobacterium sp. SMC-4 TaxID=2857059 RepID=UPI003D03AB00
MTDSPSRGEQWGPHGRQDPPVPPYGAYPGYPDPAYASQTPYGSPYQPPPTEQMPYPPYGYDPYATNQYQPGPGSQPPEPDGPKSPRWLWVVAGVAVVTVVGLVIALVIVNSSRQDTMVAPVPSPPEPSFTTPSRPAPTTTTSPRRPTTPALPPPTVPTSPRTTVTAPPGPTDTVVYTVSGTGRAINISYVDSNGLLGTEFNVMLPWSKEVALPQPGADAASVSIINVGREVTCSITVDGVVVLERTGVGLTICTGGR